jgi:ACR3 family arsenite efflux pump ArsB
MTQALESLPVTYQTWPTFLTLHLSGGLFSLTSALVALWLRYRPTGNIRAGLVRVGSVFAVGAILATALTVTFARAAGFSTGAVTVVTEIAIAVACCAFGARLGAAWWRQSVGTAHKH